MVMLDYVEAQIVLEGLKKYIANNRALSQTLLADNIDRGAAMIDNLTLYATNLEERIYNEWPMLKKE